MNAAIKEEPRAGIRLAKEVEASLDAAREIRGAAAAVHGHVPPEVRERLDTVRESLRGSIEDVGGAGGRRLADRIRLLAALDAERHDLDRESAAAGVEVLVRIHESLIRLRELSTTEDLIRATPRELCRACGFNRAMISQVRGSLWDPQVLEIEQGADPEGGDAFREYIEEVEIPLPHLLLETECVRRRIAVLVSDPPGDPRTHNGMVAISRSTSYVVAPIMPTGRVIGFLHADRFGHSVPCSPEDRDNLWAFAEQCGLIFERAVLMERLETQRSQLRDALSAAADTVDELCDAEIELLRHEETADAPRRGAAPVAPRSRLDGLLTAREREVLDLMVTGATNTTVAQRLVVSEGTVKSHVKRILRKLHASNRAEAVARYLQLVPDEDPTGRS